MNYILLHLFLRWTVLFVVVSSLDNNNVDPGQKGSHSHLDLGQLDSSSDYNGPQVNILTHGFDSGSALSPAVDSKNKENGLSDALRTIEATNKNSERDNAHDKELQKLADTQLAEDAAKNTEAVVGAKMKESEEFRAEESQNDALQEAERLRHNNSMQTIMDEEQAEKDTFKHGEQATRAKIYKEEQRIKHDGAMLEAGNEAIKEERIDEADHLNEEKAAENQRLQELKRKASEGDEALELGHEQFEARKRRKALGAKEAKNIESKKEEECEENKEKSNEEKEKTEGEESPSDTLPSFLSIRVRRHSFAG